METIFLDLYRETLKLSGRFLPPWSQGLLGMLIPIGALAVFCPVTMMYLTWLERKLVARIQDRLGPNRVGPYGLLQPIADGIKMLLKEDITPTGADKLAHFWAPVIIVVPAIVIYAFLPFGQGMAAVNLNTGLLFFFALTSAETVAIFMAGWGSRNKFSLLGAMRAAAQIVSYEVPLLLSMVVVVMTVGSMSLVDIVEAQRGFHWFLFTPWGLAGFFIFFLSGVAEVNRTPFDIPEGESEIVAGFHTEYSGMKFALLYMAEFLSAFAIGGMAATLFLGGWDGPAFLPSWGWFIAKCYLMFFGMVWLRGTFPRFRVDQLLGFAWKFMLPIALVNILAAGLWYFLPAWAAWPIDSLLLLGAWWGLSELNLHSLTPSSKMWYDNVSS